MNNLEIAKFEELAQKMMIEFPNIMDKKTPISLLDIPPREYNYWLEKKIVPKGISDDALKRAWIRLNLYDFVWVKIVVFLRATNFPYEEIVKIKKAIYKNIADILADEQEEFMDFLKMHMSESELESQSKAIEYAIKNRNRLPEEYKDLYSEFAGMINRIFFLNDDVSLIIYKIADGYESVLYSKHFSNIFKDLDSDWRDAPRIEIPLAPIVYQFMEDSKNEKNMEAWGFINRNEKKVLDAMRLNDFTEITIRLQGVDKEMIIEKVKDGDIKDQKAKEIRRILGLDLYSEITIKYRNDKHLYFKGKNRL